jgi:hypothetical protein
MKLILRWLGVLLCIGGFIFILGTIGADDRATLAETEIFSFSELVIRCLIGFGLVCIGIITYRVGQLQ